jgi:hypothetical protein
VKQDKIDALDLRELVNDRVERAASVQAEAAAIAERDELSRKAERLEERYFGLMSRANRPDIEYTEDGPRYGTTYHDAESPQLNSEVDVAEAELERFLQENRSVLESNPRWALDYVRRDATDAYMGLKKLEALEQGLGGLPADKAEELGRLRAEEAQFHDRIVAEYRAEREHERGEAER